ncbi:MAG: MmcQ/YjbR family DNA-binding protein [Chlorobi bacterium]|nr:MmcQ/YjbR family DNA-binding protein [Chlorobiota bacterium]
MRLTFDSIRRHCLKKKGKIDEGFPFDEETLVIKVHGKIFLLMDITAHPLKINLKCDPELALEFRSKYAAVNPGYHMNKKHWNTVELDGSIPASEVFEMIDHSYLQVVKGLRKPLREELLST